MVKICPSCKKFVPLSSTSCPMCGNIKLVVANNSVQETTKSTSSATKKSKEKKRKPRIPVIVIFILIIVSISVGVKYTFDNVLFGMDKCAYKLLLEASYEFKNPSSLRIVSGSFDETLYSNGVEWLYARTSATNGFGAPVSGYYMIWYDSDGEFHLDDIEDQMELFSKLGIEDELSKLELEYCVVTDQLNINKINKMLEKRWK